MSSGTAYMDCKTQGRGRSLEVPLPLFIGVQKICILSRLENHLLVRKVAIILLMHVKTSNSDSLYTRSECHVVSKA